MEISKPPPALAHVELQQLIEHINSCFTRNTEEAVFAALDWLRAFSECERLVLCQIDRATPLSFKRLINHTYGDEWIETYHIKKFSQIDPVVQLARKRKGLIRWCDAYRVAGGPRIKEFLTLARDHGLDGGVALSYLDHRLISLCSMTDSPRQDRGLEYVLESLVPTIHLTLQQKNTSFHNPLTDREIEVLQWASHGKTVWEISLILAVSQSTIKFHLANIYTKLNVSNRPQAISAAVRLGLY